MPQRDPLKLPYTRGLPRLDTLSSALKSGFKKPAVGITQGGSSRKSKGAKVAATPGTIPQSQRGQV